MKNLKTLCTVLFIGLTVSCSQDDLDNSSSELSQGLTFSATENSDNIPGNEIGFPGQEGNTANPGMVTPDTSNDNQTSTIIGYPNLQTDQDQPSIEIPVQGGGTPANQKEAEALLLSDLLNEIVGMTSQISCSEANQWQFAPYGSKPCGGPQGYLAYSNNINVTSFLNKVTDYTEKDDAFNVKWGIMSDCTVAMAPEELICHDGVPIILY
jgi:hypothetical protein